MYFHYILIMLLVIEYKSRKFSETSFFFPDDKRKSNPIWEFDIIEMWDKYGNKNNDADPEKILFNFLSIEYVYI